jgi:hypothetical protein
MSSDNWSATILAIFDSGLRASMATPIAVADQHCSPPATLA